MSPRRLFDLPPEMTERKWQTTLQKGLTRTAWRWQHIFRMRTADGAWRTSTTAVGWPDLMAFREGWVLAIECKRSRKDYPTPDQLAWLAEIAQIPTGRAWVLRPTDSWQDVANWIADPAKSPRIYGFEPPYALALATS